MAKKQDCYCNTRSGIYNKGRSCKGDIEYLSGTIKEELYSHNQKLTIYENKT